MGDKWEALRKLKAVVDDYVEHFPPMAEALMMGRIVRPGQPDAPSLTFGDLKAIASILDGPTAEADLRAMAEGEMVLVRRSPLLQQVRRLFTERRRLKVADVVATMPGVPKKRIYNAFGYLARHGEIEQREYGLYETARVSAKDWLMATCICLKHDTVTAWGCRECLREGYAAILEESLAELHERCNISATPAAPDGETK